MKNIRLYYPNSIAENSTVLISKQHAHYVVNVMRLKRGSNINFFNNTGEWLSEIVFLERDRVEVKFLNKIKNNSERSKVELAICLVKKNPMELIFEKASELGVHKIIPIISGRTEVKELNYERVQKIVIEATEQSNQLSPPQISKVISLKNFLVGLSKSTQLLFADVNSKSKLKVNNLKSKNTKTILIGPEGDFSPSERELILSKANSTSFSISKNILRSETAVISAISLVNFINKFH